MVLPLRFAAALVAGVTALSACTPTVTNGAATVVAVDYHRDPNHPTTGTHQAECRDPAGTEWRVAINATQADQLNSGDPCPAGPHEQMPQQQYPEIQSALNTPLPYSGGDQNSPCGEWSAASKADAAQMQAAWDTCMTHVAKRGGE
jgi:hypothetical protein